MCIESPDDLAGLQPIGTIVALTLEAMSRAVRPGVSTAELGAIAADELARWGAQVPNFEDRSDPTVLSEGMVITIERRARPVCCGLRRLDRDHVRPGLVGSLRAHGCDYAE